MSMEKSPLVPLFQSGTKGHRKVARLPFVKGDREGFNSTTPPPARRGERE